MSAAIQTVASLDGGDARNVRSLRCAVAGAGTLGNHVILELCRQNVGGLLLIDPDLVEPGNLEGSVLFASRPCVGEYKVDAAAAVIRERFPNLKVRAMRMEIGDVGFQDLAGCAAIFSCVDSDLARTEIGYIGKRLERPVMDGGVGRRGEHRGRVTWFPGGKDAACFGCLLSGARRAELLAEWEAVTHSCIEGEPDHFGSADPAMSCTIGKLQVELALRALQEDDLSAWSEGRQGRVAISRSVHCPFHEDGEQTVDAAAGDTFGDLLRKAGGQGAVVLDWPICVAARCGCGHGWPAFERVARLRRRVRCPACGSGSVREVEVLREIGRDSPWIGCAPQQVGLPERHRYTIRGCA